MDKKWHAFYCSSSIGNFEDKLKKRLGLPTYSVLMMNKPVLFIGLYHSLDYMKFLFHRGRKAIFWCGSDILQIPKKLLPQLREIKEQYCENWIEREKLQSMGIKAEITPMVFEELGELGVHFTPSDRIHVYLCVHEGRIKEYGMFTIWNIAKKVPWVTFHVYGIHGKNPSGNILYHGKVSNEQFNEEIKNYHGALRLNEFDGCSEVMVKSAIMGQYPISFIRYDKVWTYATEYDLIKRLKNIAEEKEPNLVAREFWIKQTADSLNKILYD